MSAPLLQASDAQTFTASDTANILVPQNIGLYVGGTGDIKVTTAAGSIVTFKSVPVGPFYIKLAQVFATGTTATNLLLLI